MILIFMLQYGHTVNAFKKANDFRQNRSPNRYTTHKILTRTAYKREDC